MYKIFLIKRYLEQIIMFPFILFGKWKASLSPLQEEYDIFFFFPAYTIGGAERVNAEIIKSFTDKKVIIFFTKKSPNEGMLHFFQLPHVTVKEISLWTDNKYKYWNNLIYRGVCSFYINTQKKQPVVFIGQCNFGYKITPHIHRNIHISELIHMYDEKFLWVWAPFIQFINARVLLADSIKNTFKASYIRNGIPLQFLERIQIIPNCLEYIPEHLTKKEFKLPLKIYYAGRGGPQKRIWLIVKIIEQCRLLNLPVEFKLAGSFKDEMPINFIEDRTYVGELKGGEEMYQFHKQNEILLMTSAWEGFPMVIMEALAFGSVPLVTDVDAIPEHIIESTTGFLLNSSFTEEEIVSQAVEKIKYLTQNTNMLIAISKTNFDYVKVNFRQVDFQNSYRKIILNH
jgi:glycosyltransferase involved in cell wall biosynthesis